MAVNKEINELDAAAALTGAELIELEQSSGGVKADIDDVIEYGREKYLHVSDLKADGVVGGGFTKDAWQTRVLNTVGTNEITGASLATNQITLPAGTYRLAASAPAQGVEFHQARIQDTTGAATLLLGSSNYTSNADAVFNHSFITGQFTIGVESDIELQHYCSQTNGVNGFGQACSFGVGEVYSVVEIWEII